MANNDPPSEEEVDEFMELYEKHGNKKAVAEEVDWSRPTVSKWIDRRIEAQEEAEEEAEEETEPTDMEDETETIPKPSGTEPDPAPVPEDVIEEPKAPNEILLEIIDRDPKLGDDEKAYIRQFFPDYGQLSPSDVTAILQDLSFNNKRMTISRVNKHYEKAINTRLRENPDLQYDERWATLLTKTTGDTHYIREAQKSSAGGGISGGIQPPSRGGGGEGDSITPPQEGGTPTSPGSNGGITPPPRGTQAANQQPPNTQPPRAPGPQYQQGGGRDELSAFEERLIGMLEEQMGGESQQPAPQPAEQQSATGQIQELIELQSKLDQLQDRGGQEAQMAEQVQAVVGQMEQKIERLEQQIAQTNQTQELPDPDPSGDDGSMLGEIAVLADKIDDPELLSMLIEMETDPEVLEARAKNKEIENDTEWKKSLAESLTPAAAEKAVEAFTNLSSGISQQAQPRPAQQPQPAQQQEQRNVEVVNDEPQERPKASPEVSSDTSSPLREEGEEVLDGDSEDSSERDAEEDNEDDE